MAFTVNVLWRHSSLIGRVDPFWSTAADSIRSLGLHADLEATWARRSPPPNSSTNAELNTASDMASENGSHDT